MESKSRGSFFSIHVGVSQQRGSKHSKDLSSVEKDSTNIRDQVLLGTDSLNLSVVLVGAKVLLLGVEEIL